MAAIGLIGLGLLGMVLRSYGVLDDSRFNRALEAGKKRCLLFLDQGHDGQGAFYEGPRVRQRHVAVPRAVRAGAGRLRRQGPRGPRRMGENCGGSGVRTHTGHGKAQSAQRLRRPVSRRVAVSPGRTAEQRTRPMALEEYRQTAGRRRILEAAGQLLERYGQPLPPVYRPVRGARSPRRTRSADRETLPQPRGWWTSGRDGGPTISFFRFSATCSRRAGTGRPIVITSRCTLSERALPATPATPSSGFTDTTEVLRLGALGEAHNLPLVMGEMQRRGPAGERTAS